MPNSVTQLAVSFDITITALLSGSIVYNMLFTPRFANRTMQLVVLAANPVLARNSASSDVPLLGPLPSQAGMTATDHGWRR